MRSAVGDLVPNGAAERSMPSPLQHADGAPPRLSSGCRAGSVRRRDRLAEGGREGGGDGGGRGVLEVVRGRTRCRLGPKSLLLLSERESPCVSVRVYM